MYLTDTDDDNDEIKNYDEGYGPSAKLTFHIDKRAIVQIITGFVDAVIASSFLDRVGVFLRIIIGIRADRRLPEVDGRRRKPTVVRQTDERTFVYNEI